MTYSNILVVGAGLIGTSIALARKSLDLGDQFDAVEVSEENRADAQKWNVYQHVYSNIDQVSKSYDLLILATPPSVSASLLEWSLKIAETVTDVCSVKLGICRKASALGSEAVRFIPGHPMAGKASGGPREADASLFQDRPWIFLGSAERSEPLQSWSLQMGAVPTVVENARQHDEMMSFVSHGIHLASLTAMLASDESISSTGETLAPIAGPAFWDITRLAASPPEFWVDTLLMNRESVMDYLTRLTRQVEQFQSILASGDASRLRDKLLSASAARSRWEADRKPKS